MVPEAPFGRPFDTPLTLEEHRSEWAEHFAVVDGWLRDALGAAAKRIDHIGSTAVPGLAAKPVIDVQVSVADIDDERQFRPALESLGYELIHHAEPEWYFFRRRNGLRDAHIHVTQSGCEWARLNLLFRDYLRSNPDVAQSYVDLKYRLAAEHGHDRGAYTDGKTEFVTATLAAAEKWAAGTSWAKDAWTA